MAKLIQVLGIGCAKCHKLRKHAETAVAELGLDADVELVDDIEEITAFDVVMTPALVIDGHVRVVGKVLSVGEMKQLLESGNSP